MDLSFFRPSKRKIILSFLIMMVLGTLPIIPVYQIIMCVRTPCYPIPGGYSSIYSLNNYALISLMSYIMIILELILSYLLACFILNIYQKKIANK